MGKTSVAASVGSVIILFTLSPSLLLIVLLLNPIVRSIGRITAFSKQLAERKASRTEAMLWIWWN